MTDKRSPDERQALAAEQALRLLTGAERAQAAALERDDAAFAGEVARWRGRFAPLISDVAPVAPPAGLWGRIEQATLQGSDATNVVVLRRSRSRWRAAAAAMTAIAAALALILVEQPRTAQAPVVAPPARGTPMVAMLGDGGKSMKVVASWDPSARQLVLAVSGDMPSDPAHAHQLWVIPSDGKPRSLGTMAASKQMHMRLADALARLLQQGATIAISVEPPGGSPTGQPTGPVVASGALKKA
jgi:anti-sigma-K factor RskA